MDSLFSFFVTKEERKVSESTTRDELLDPLTLDEYIIAAIRNSIQYFLNRSLGAMVARWFSALTLA